MVLIRLQQRLEHLKVGCHSLRKEENGYTDFYNSLNNVGGNARENQR